MPRIARFLSLAGAPIALRRELVQRGTPVTLPARTQISNPLDGIGGLVFVLQGRMRCSMCAPDGSEVMLGRHEAGDCAVLSAAKPAVINGFELVVHAVTDLDLLILSKPAMDGMMERSADFRGLVFRASYRHLAELAMLSEQRMDRPSAPRNC